MTRRYFSSLLGAVGLSLSLCLPSFSEPEIPSGKEDWEIWADAVGEKIRNEYSVYRGPHSVGMAAEDGYTALPTTWQPGEKWNLPDLTEKLRQDEEDLVAYFKINSGGPWNVGPIRK